MNRCKWCNLNNPIYIKYHDDEWGVLHLDDERYLFEMLVLESFQAGLSWECVLNKREDFRQAFCDFNPRIIKDFDANKINELLNNQKIIRNKSKIIAAINNARIFIDIQKEFTSFKEYLLSFWNEKVVFENDRTTNELSDSISKDLKRRGMKFVGSTIIYSFLQAIGIINSHDDDCFLHIEGEKK